MNIKKSHLRECSKAYRKNAHTCNGCGFGNECGIDKKQPVKPNPKHVILSLDATAAG